MTRKEQMLRKNKKNQIVIDNIVTPPIVQEIQTQPIYEYEGIVTDSIKQVYPNAKVINMTAVIQASYNFNTNAKQLLEYTKDDNNFIVVYNFNTNQLNKFHSMYMTLKRVPLTAIHPVLNHIAVVLVRGETVTQILKSELINSNSIIRLLKTILKPVIKECSICYKEFDLGEKRLSA